ncbi:MAG TPA: hypothetical protein VMI31_05720 [Fimbriimonadaceae bacterium]|nr:hypothetical protein [Fimbriimonadaceae bacterium]
MLASAILLAGCTGKAAKRVPLAPGGGKVTLRFHPPKGDSYLYQRDFVGETDTTETRIIQTDILSTDNGEVRVVDTIKEINNTGDSEERAKRRQESFKGAQIDRTCDQYAIVRDTRFPSGGADSQTSEQVDQDVSPGLQGVVFPSNPVGENWQWPAELDWSDLLKIIGNDAKLCDTPTATFTLKGAEDDGWRKLAVIDYKMVIKLSLFSSLFDEGSSAAKVLGGPHGSAMTVTILQNGTLRVDMGTGMVTQDRLQMDVIAGSHRRTRKATVTLKMLQMTRRGVTTKFE